MEPHERAWTVSKKKVPIKPNTWKFVEQVIGRENLATAMKDPAWKKHFENYDKKDNPEFLRKLAEFLMAIENPTLRKGVGNYQGLLRANHELLLTKWKKFISSKAEESGVEESERVRRVHFKF